MDAKDIEEQINDTEYQIANYEEKLKKNLDALKLGRVMLIALPIGFLISLLANVNATLVIGLPFFGGFELCVGGTYYLITRKNKKLKKTIEVEKEHLENLKDELGREKELQNTPEYRIEKTKSAVENFKKNINQDFESILGISYDDYQKLSPDEKQQLIKDFHKKADSSSIVDDSQEELPSLTISDKELSEERKTQIIETISESERLMTEERGFTKKLTRKDN